MVKQKWFNNGKVNENCAVFFNVRDRFGGLSNMAGSFPAKVNGVFFGSSEALYQACKFPENPGLQAEIGKMASPLFAKSKARKNEDGARGDWEEVKVEVMRWVLRVKRAQNPFRIKAIFKDTNGRQIVERSRKDKFWGAVLEDDGFLHGENRLGVLLGEVRDEKTGPVPPPAAPGFLIAGRPAGEIPAEAPWTLAS